MSTTNSLGTALSVKLSWTQLATLTDLTVISDPGKIEYGKSTTNGTAVDLADVVWHDLRTLASSGNDDLDLTALNRSIFGTSVTSNFARVKEIVIVNLNAVTGDFLRLDSSVTNGNTGPFGGSITSKIEVGADSPLVLASKKDGWAVDGTHKVLRINNPSAHSIQYYIGIIGTSA